MDSKTLLTAAATLAFAAWAATATAATPIGDADPGYPGLVNGQIVPANSASKTMPRLSAVRIDAPLAQGEAFYFPEAVGEVKTRAQVRAETLEAIRVGAMNQGERSTFATAQQLESIRLAGLRAVAPTLAGTRSEAGAN